MYKKGLVLLLFVGTLTVNAGALQKDIKVWESLVTPIQADAEGNVTALPVAIGVFPIFGRDAAREVAGLVEQVISIEGQGPFSDAFPDAGIPCQFGISIAVGISSEHLVGQFRFHFPVVTRLVEGTSVQGVVPGVVVRGRIQGVEGAGVECSPTCIEGPLE